MQDEIKRFEAEIKAQKEEMEKFERLRKEVEELERSQIDVIENIICCSPYRFSEVTRMKVRHFIRTYGYTEVVTSAEIARDLYIIGLRMGARYALDKLGGILWNRAKQKADNE